MRVVRGDLIELVLQRPQARHTVHELEVSFRFVVRARVVDDRVANGLVHSTGEVEWHARVLEPRGPRILVHHPYQRPLLAQDAVDAIEEDRLAIREVQQDEPDGPLPRSVRPREVLFAEREELQRLVPGRFELRDEFHRWKWR